MLKVKGTRTFQELRVGQLNCSVEVLLFLRLSDLDWFQTRSREHHAAICHLLSSSILPRMCGDEMEQEFPHLFPKIDVGEKNYKSTKSRPRKRKKKPGKTRGNQEPEVVGQAQEEEDTDAANKKSKPVYYAFGEKLQLAYKVLDITKEPKSVTLVFRDNQNINDKENGSNDSNSHDKKKFNRNSHAKSSGDFQQLKKLSKRFLLWCYPLDNDDDDDDNEDDKDGDDDGGHPRQNKIKSSLSCGGFLRPEFIPISLLFRTQNDDH